MDLLFFEGARKKPYLTPALILVSSIAILILNMYGIEYGITYVLPHLFYIPIILAAYYYPQRGILFALCLSICYSVIAFTVVPPTTAESLSALARCGVFVFIAAVVSYLSGRMHQDAKKCLRLVSVVRSSADAIIGETPDGIITDWNQGAEQLYGFTPDEMIGTSVLKRIPANRQEEKRLLLEKIRHGGTIERIETERITKEGRHIQISLSSSPIVDSFGNIIGISEIAHDITDQKRAEEEIRSANEQLAASSEELQQQFNELANNEQQIRNSEEKYRNLFENMLEGFAYCQMIYDSTGNPVDWIYLNVNPAFEQLTGLKNIAGKRVLEAIPDIKNLTPELFDTYGRVASTGIPEIFEIDFKPLNMWLNVSVFSPEKGYFVAVFEDITKRHIAEDGLRESEKRYRDLFEINNAVMLLIDQKTGEIVDANSAACRFYGYSLEELTRLKISAINIADSNQIRKDMDHVVDSKGAVFQFQHRKKSGEIRNIQAFSSPITLGKKLLLHSIIQDITGQKLAEDALKQTNKKLNLLSSITRHDINNQLFSLMAFIELSKESLDNRAQLSEYLLKEERAADAIKRQIAFTKEYQDLGVSDPVWQNIETCVNNAIESLPMRDIHIDYRAGNLEIYADPLFEKVFYNLTDNALRYGGAKMTIIAISSRVSDSNLVILFEDDGSGISAGDKRRLFERGFGKHTGLGLFLSREILSITGITITENGEPGKGARFEITVPEGAWRQQ